MQREGNGHSAVETHDPAENPLFATLARVEHDLKDVIGALALLGVKRCSQCKQFFRSADPGALFDYGQFVCYTCVPDWWPSESRGSALKSANGLRESWHRGCESTTGPRSSR